MKQKKIYFVLLFSILVLNVVYMIDRNQITKIIESYKKDIRIIDAELKTGSNIMEEVNFVDICCGLAWGDEAKGKITSELASSQKYDFVCRWAGGDNAGHTIYIGSKKYETHLIPSGIFYNINSIIGPDCVVNVEGFLNEINYLIREC